MTVPIRSASGNNPDFIYRATFFDGAGRYEIVGRLDPARRPAQIMFEFMHGTPGDRMLKPQRPGKSVDFGNQIAMLTDRDMEIAADGGFRILINCEEDGPNHVRTGPGPIAITIREALSDWATQLPARLAIRRLDAGETTPELAPQGREALRARILADLPGHLRFWGSFPDLWYGRQALNVLNGPVPRDGGWGFVGGVRFRLAPGEGFLVRVRHAGASYVGAQVSDPWGMVPDVERHFSSLGAAQSVPDADGTYTYIAAPADPGIANWLDTGGLHEGGLALRWQGFGADVDGSTLVQEARIIRLDEVRHLTGPARVTPGQRQESLARRVQAYRTRLGQ